MVRDGENRISNKNYFDLHHLFHGNEEQMIRLLRLLSISSIFVSKICQIRLVISRRKYGIVSKQKQCQYIGEQVILRDMFQKIV